MRAFCRYAILPCHHGTRDLKFQQRGKAFLPNPPHEGGLTMAIFRAKTEYDVAQEIKEFGAEQKNKQHVKVVDFSYESVALAEMIVDAWTNEGFETELLKKENAVRMLADRGISLKGPRDHGSRLQ